jgi:hypothetical protein
MHDELRWSVQRAQQINSRNRVIPTVPDGCICSISVDSVPGANRSCRRWSIDVPTLAPRILRSRAIFAESHAVDVAVGAFSIAGVYGFGFANTLGGTDGAWAARLICVETPLRGMIDRRRSSSAAAIQDDGTMP